MIALFDPRSIIWRLRHRSASAPDRCLGCGITKYLAFSVNPLYERIGNIVRQSYDMRIEGPPVLDVPTNFPSAEKFSSAWQSIRDEARAVAQQMHRVPRFREIMREQTSISANDMRDWRMFILKAYGAEFPRNMDVCPTLAAFVTASPDVLSASFAAQSN